jgi:REP element-mobilizing transposase RayT
MSLPRAIVPGRRYMITLRCSERRFFMRPDRETNNAFIYCLALAARKAGISIVCVGTLSNHYHAVVVDNHGRLPQFLEHFHNLYGKHQNALRGRWEAFWTSERLPWSSWSRPRTCLERWFTRSPTRICVTPSGSGA